MFTDADAARALLSGPPWWVVYPAAPYPPPPSDSISCHHTQRDAAAPRTTSKHSRLSRKANRLRCIVDIRWTWRCSVRRKLAIRSDLGTEEEDRRRRTLSPSGGTLESLERHIQSRSIESVSEIVLCCLISFFDSHLTGILGSSWLF